MQQDKNSSALVPILEGLTTSADLKEYTHPPSLPMNKPQRTLSLDSSTRGGINSYRNLKHNGYLRPITNSPFGFSGTPEQQIIRQQNDYDSNLSQFGSPSYNQNHFSSFQESIFQSSGVSRKLSLPTSVELLETHAILDDPLASRNNSYTYSNPVGFAKPKPGNIGDYDSNSQLSPRSLANSSSVVNSADWNYSKNSGNWPSALSLSTPTWSSQFSSTFANVESSPHNSTTFDSEYSEFSTLNFDENSAHEDYEKLMLPPGIEDILDSTPNQEYIPFRDRSKSYDFVLSSVAVGRADSSSPLDANMPDWSPGVPRSTQQISQELNQLRQLNTQNQRQFLPYVANVITQTQYASPGQTSPYHSTSFSGSYNPPNSALSRNSSMDFDYLAMYTTGRRSSNYELPINQINDGNIQFSQERRFSSVSSHLSPSGDGPFTPYSQTEHIINSVMDSMAGMTLEPYEYAQSPTQMGIFSNTTNALDASVNSHYNGQTFVVRTPSQKSLNDGLTQTSRTSSNSNTPKRAMSWAAIAKTPAKPAQQSEYGDPKRSNSLHVHVGNVKLKARNSELELREQKRKRVLEIMNARGLNPDINEFNCNPLHARFFVIKSYTEDDVHKSLKYSIWASTEIGNRRLNQAFSESGQIGPIYLFYSVNASGHFCGVAKMTTKVDWDRTSTVWAQDGKWKGSFGVKWIFVKNVPNSVLRHLRVVNNENKPVTNSRDTQELLPDIGHEMLRIFCEYQAKNCILDEWQMYDKQEQDRRMSVPEVYEGNASSGTGGPVGCDIPPAVES
ncbi:hypothetical protein HK098_006360 [Nowakowskiella sp. JEL0407]|nr:hypothetical protein HK098_006360 [Nowakowskiella sp. JEL0407]